MSAFSMGLLLNVLPPSWTTRLHLLNPADKLLIGSSTSPYLSIPPSLNLGENLGQHKITSPRHLITKTKTTHRPPPSHLTPNCMYKISCLDCSSSYDGQTYRPLITNVATNSTAFSETLLKRLSLPSLSTTPSRLDTELAGTTSTTCTSTISHREQGRRCPSGITFS